jgi:hypothetical protein
MIRFESIKLHEFLLISDIPSQKGPTTAVFARMAKGIPPCYPIMKDEGQRLSLLSGDIMTLIVYALKPESGVYLTVQDRWTLPAAAVVNTAYLIRGVRLMQDQGASDDIIDAANILCRNIHNCIVPVTIVSGTNEQVNAELRGLTDALYDIRPGY